MNRLLPLALASAAVFVPAALLAAERGEDAPVREAPRVEDPRGLGVGRLLPDVAYTDTARPASCPTTEGGRSWCWRAA
jgi:hypothetical protein